MSEGWVGYPAPGKLNLFLHVNARRPDGYHELQTVFQLLDHGDEVLVRARDDGRIVRTRRIPGVGEDEDLCVRAARLLAEHAGPVPGADIAVRKRLPMGGGLGGGSSDAASVLVALDRLWGLGLGQRTLARLGLGLGADVPVFVHGHSAWAEGVGEHLVPVSIEPAWYLVVTPPVHVSTASVFTAARLTRDTPRMKMGDFLRDGYIEGSASRPRLSAADLIERTTNDCEPVVEALHAEVAEALGWLSDLPARMTGTGASVFALVGDEDSGQARLGALPSGWRGFVARGVDDSPLATRG